MRILHVVPTYLPAVRYGGPIFSVHALCRALVRHGHEVHVFTTNVDGASESDVPTGTECDLDGVKVRYFPVPSFRRLYRAPALDACIERELDSFDLVHGHSVFLWPTWAAARRARQAGKPYVLSPRGMLVKALIRRRSPWLKSAWIHLIERHNLQGASAIHVTSEEEAREIRRFGFRLGHIEVIANGVDMPLPVEAPVDLPGWPAAGKVLLFLGRISWKKGLDRLIPALAFMPDVHLVVAGNDEEKYTARLVGMAHNAGVLERVHFIGPAYGAKKQALLARATALVLPSYSENFGNVVLEAMAAGCPIAVTREVGASEIVERAQAGIVIPVEPESMALSLVTFLSGPAIGEMGGRGRMVVAGKYSWEQVAAKMTGVYMNAWHGWRDVKFT